MNFGTLSVYQFMSYILLTSYYDTVHIQLIVYLIGLLYTNTSVALKCTSKIALALREHSILIEYFI
jgi:hypothetical protein